MAGTCVQPDGVQGPIFNPCIIKSISHVVVERCVRVGLADEEKVKTVEQGLAAERLAGVEVVARQGGLERRPKSPANGRPAP